MWTGVGLVPSSVLIDLRPPLWVTWVPVLRDIIVGSKIFQNGVTETSPGLGLHVLLISSAKTAATFHVILTFLSEQSHYQP